MRTNSSYLIGVTELQSLVKLVVASGYLKNHKPLSLILVGKVGAGKTEIINTFSCKNAVFLSDLSSTGVFDILNENKEITHLIIPDFTKITMKNKQTSNNLLTTLNSGIEEGLGKIRLKNTNVDVSINGETRHIGLLTATTKKSYAQNKNKFESFGFSSRFIIASFDYSDKTTLDIFESIHKCEYLKEKFKQIPLKDKKNLAVKKKNIILSYELSKNLDNLKNNSFRTLKQLQALACSSALVSGRSEVTKEDIEEVKKLNKFFNLNFTKI